MRRANGENTFPRPTATTEIRARNFLGRTRSSARADLIVTSPPYVTSYNYADIHQLSTLWLGYASDYRSLRRNMLGNRHGVRTPQAEAIRRLGNAAWRTYRDMRKEDPGHASSIARYFVDLDKAVRRCWEVLEPGGMAVFVIGNTQYKGVKVDNAAHLACEHETCRLPAGVGETSEGVAEDDDAVPGSKGPLHPELERAAGLRGRVRAHGEEKVSMEPLSIRPYARLLTMLGEQLLKNERIALV